MRRGGRPAILGRMSTAPQTVPPETVEFEDPATGVTVRQVTRGECDNHQLYFTHPTWSPDGKWPLLPSDRGGGSALWVCHHESGELTRVSPHGVGWATFSRHSPTVYHFREDSLYVVDVETLDERRICRLAQRFGHIAGTPSESADGRRLAFCARESEERYHLAYAEVASGEVEGFYRWHRRPGHVQCSPVDPELVMFGDESVSDHAVKQGMWVIRMDGSGFRAPHLQQPGEMVTHESWLGRTGDILYCYWPVSLQRVSPDEARDRTVARLNFWHPAASPEGEFAVADPNWPERGLQQVEVKSGKRVALCCSGDWADSATEVHRHPSFSPDGRRMAFSSCRGGHGHVCGMEQDWRWLLETSAATVAEPPWARGAG